MAVRRRRGINRLAVDHLLYDVVAVPDKDLLILEGELCFRPGAERTLRFFQGAAVLQHDIAE